MPGEGVKDSDMIMNALNFFLLCLQTFIPTSLPCSHNWWVPLCVNELTKYSWKERFLGALCTASAGSAV